MRKKLKKFVESPHFNFFILALILIDSLMLGLKTSDTINQFAGPFLILAGNVIISIFVIELILKLSVFGIRFFKDGFNCLDFILVSISLLEVASTARIFRVLRLGRLFRSARSLKAVRTVKSAKSFKYVRILRTVPAFKELRIIVFSIISSLPSIAWSFAFLTLLLYFFGVVGYELFAENFPELFGSLGGSMWSLVQIMTFDSWSSGIARPVMSVYPMSFFYFVPYVIFSTFVILEPVPAAI
jgi:voltage-gated sodium channel